MEAGVEAAVHHLMVTEFFGADAERALASVATANTGDASGALSAFSDSPFPADGCCFLDHGAR